MFTFCQQTDLLQHVCCSCRQIAFWIFTCPRSWEFTSIHALNKGSISTHFYHALASGSRRPSSSGWAQLSHVPIFPGNSPWLCSSRGGTKVPRFCQTLPRFSIVAVSNYAPTIQTTRIMAHHDKVWERRSADGLRASHVRRTRWSKTKSG